MNWRDHATSTSSRLAHRFERTSAGLVHEIEVDGRAMSSVIADEGDPESADLQGAWWRAFLRGSQPEVPVSAPVVRAMELFCGSGGLALGFEEACRELGLQMRSMAAIDQDAEAVAIYRRHNSTRTTSTKSVSALVDYRIRGQGEACSFLYEPEVVEPTWAALKGHIDVVLAGPPCQGHSGLNNKTRRTDTRNQLYLTVPAIAVALKVPVVVIENVQAAVHDRKQVVQSTIALLETAGYHVTTGVLKAAELGWPQRRDRLFLVARLDRSPLDLTVVKAAFRDDPRTLWWAIGDLVGQPGDEYMDMQPEFSDENRRRIDWLFDNDQYDLALDQRPDCHKDGTTYNSMYGRLYADRPAPTITTGFLTAGRGRYIHPTERRVLTPREAARLQGFPDTYDFRPNGSTVPSRLKLTKWIGDAVPMPLGYAAGISALGAGWGSGSMISRTPTCTPARSTKPAERP